MKINKLDKQGVILNPETASDHSFLAYFIEMIEAREAKIISGLGSTPSAKLQSHAQDHQPYITDTEA